MSCRKDCQTLSDHVFKSRLTSRLWTLLWYLSFCVVLQSWVGTRLALSRTTRSQKATHSRSPVWNWRVPRRRPTHGNWWIPSRIRTLMLYAQVDVSLWMMMVWPTLSTQWWSDQLDLFYSVDRFSPEPLKGHVNYIYYCVPSNTVAFPHENIRMLSKYYSNVFSKCLLCSLAILLRPLKILLRSIEIVILFCSLEISISFPRSTILRSHAIRLHYLKIIFWKNAILMQENAIVFQGNAMLLRENTIVFRGSEI